MIGPNIVFFTSAFTVLLFLRFPLDTHSLCSTVFIIFISLLALKQNGAFDRSSRRCHYIEANVAFACFQKKINSIALTYFYIYFYLFFLLILGSLSLSFSFSILVIEMKTGKFSVKINSISGSTSSIGILFSFGLREAKKKKQKQNGMKVGANRNTRIDKNSGAKNNFRFVYFFFLLCPVCSYIWNWTKWPE